MVQLASEAVLPTRAVKLIVLDRDGVINYDSASYISNSDDWQPLPGSLEAIAKLTQAGYHIVVATNQSAIGRGLLEMATLNAIHDKMHRAVAQVGGRIDAVFYCPHSQEDNCRCRKPRAGLLEEISRRFNTELKDVSSIGDALRDLQAAATAGAQPVLVLTGKGEMTRQSGELPAGTRIYADLAAAAKSIIK
jgi:D-glycero-D-manno-heptose 1,7-bisphosphate phosphatase